jgi:hypothetical protein
MEDKEIIERLEDIIETLKKGEREQAECDLSDLYEEIQDEYEDYDEDEEDGEYETDDEEEYEDE